LKTHFDKPGHFCYTFVLCIPLWQTWPFLLICSLLIWLYVNQLSYVQVQRRSLAPTLGSLFHDHLFSILFVFTGVFLVNYVLLSSAADESGNITLVSYQDGIELMNQVCSISVRLSGPLFYSLLLFWQQSNSENSMSPYPFSFF